MEISSVDDLRKFAAYVRAGGETAGKTFRLTANLNLSATENLAPIENFSGTFDGGGKTIKNLTLNNPSADCQGFFGVLENATVKNLTLKNFSVSANYYVGGLAGGAINSVVENVTIIGGEVVGASKFNAGGLVGICNGSTFTGNKVDAEILPSGGAIAGFQKHSTFSENFFHSSAKDDTGATRIFKIADNCSGLGGVEISGKIIEFGGSRFAATGTEIIFTIPDEAGFDTADIIGAEKITANIFKFTVGAKDCLLKLQGRKILGDYEFVVDGNIYAIDSAGEDYL